MGKYNILDWIESFENSKGKVDEKTDFLESRSRILYPGRFYVLHYKAKTKERYNTRPVIISMGVSQKDPDSFLCVDLSVMPKKVRMKFLEFYFRTYDSVINENMQKYPSVGDADKQGWMKSFTYENFIKTMPMIPAKYAIKRYKIENTLKIYSVPFIKVYKIAGDYCDENYYVNGTISEIQTEFISKMRK